MDPALWVSFTVLGSILACILSLLPQVQSAGVTPERLLGLTLACVLLALLVTTAYRQRDTFGKPALVAPKEQEEAKEEATAAKEEAAAPKEETSTPKPAKVLYATTTGTAKDLAEHFAKKYTSQSAVNLAAFDEDSLASETEVVFFVSTITGGEHPDSCVNFFKAVEEATTDFRYGSGAFANLKFAVFGLGNSNYSKRDFCMAAKRLDKWLFKLGAKRLRPVGLGDDSQDLYAQVEDWMNGAVQVQQQPIKPEIVQEEEACGTYSDEEDDYDEEEENEEDVWNNALINEEPPLDDVEDLDIVGHFDKPSGKAGATGAAAAEMVTPMQRKNLTKQGYKLIGSHSAVKLCRWTKAAIRGRGFCYKRTFYGINSHQCMEATPSLACANKCVFCWRTHTNPVGREWRWKQDEPDMIVTQACEEHMKMMKTLRGIEGALPERLKESQTIRHCALSLVGEPIMYPRINEVLQGLHDRRISSFLVTNAQFPQAILDLNPVTQLYVSVDASTKDALKEIDRPLFTDFWERFNDSLDALGTVNGRTVFRLTLVKDRNIGTDEALDGYARLIARSKPDLVEIKGVTFCGKSNASDITMKDVPWHHEVRSFSEQLCARVQHFSDESNEYGVACEHAHSVCVLLARKDKFYVEDDGWYTWIDFDRFLVLAEEWRTTGKRFNGMDFRAKTPEWAVYGSKEEGFDPSDTRFRKVRRHKADTASVVGGGEEDDE